MRTTVMAVLMLGGVGLLGACSAKHDTSTTTTTTTTASTTAPAVAAMAPKAGLWEMTVSGGGMPASMKTKICIGAPTPGVATNSFTPPPQPGQTCARNNVVKTATGYAVDMECAMNGMTMTTTGDVTGDFTSDYKTVMTTKMTGANVPAMMQTEHTSTSEAKYLGQCPAGMAPGTATRGA